VQPIIQTWAALNMRKRVIVVAATLAVFGAVVLLARLATQPSMSLLYAGLETVQAGEVVQALEQRGVAYDVRGGSIFVPAAQRDELRMTMASEGLPANNAQGYELLDTLTGFGTTSQMFDAAYWRAKEGELARTVLANPQIRAARVHIANTTSNPFQRDLRGSASVAVTTSGGGLSPEQARAIKFLVSSAVAGLDPNDVAVIDSNGGLVASSDNATPVSAGEDRAQKIREQVLRLLEARVGTGNAVVEVSVETVTESESIRERLVDPESRVAISTDTEERSNTSNDAGGSVTVASNLPDGDAAAGESSSQNSEVRERVNYEVSETEREILRVPGAIKRLSVAVMINESALAAAPEGAAEVDAVPDAAVRATEELASMRDLVASAVGLDEARGDVLTLKSMSFTPLGTDGTTASAGFLSNMTLDVMSLIQMAVAALVALVLGFFVVRPILTKPPSDALALPGTVPEEDGASAGADRVGGPDEAGNALTGEIDDGDGFAPLVPATRATELASDDPVERLRQLINERQDETVEVLRGWLDDKQEKA